MYFCEREEWKKMLIHLRQMLSDGLPKRVHDGECKDNTINCAISCAIYWNMESGIIAIDKCLSSFDDVQVTERHIISVFLFVFSSLISCEESLKLSLISNKMQNIYDILPPMKEGDKKILIEDLL
jgi:hypothetical protein